MGCPPSQSAINLKILNFRQTWEEQRSNRTLETRQTIQQTPRKLIKHRNDRTMKVQAEPQVK